LKENLLKMKQILTCVGDLPEKLTTKDKFKPLGSQKVELDSEETRVTRLEYLVMPLGTKNIVSTCVTASKIIG
jgi:hypothetical protein